MASPVDACAFVDGRYTVQVRKQVPEADYEILHVLEDPHLDWLADQLPKGARVAYDPRLHPRNWQRKAHETLAKAEKSHAGRFQKALDNLED